MNFKPCSAVTSVNQTSPSAGFTDSRRQPPMLARSAPPSKVADNDSETRRVFMNGAENSESSPPTPSQSWTATESRASPWGNNWTQLLAQLREDDVPFVAIDAEQSAGFRIGRDALAGEWRRQRGAQFKHTGVLRHAQTIDN